MDKDVAELLFSLTDQVQLSAADPALQSKAELLTRARSQLADILNEIEDE
jgi:hypothetical protein